jgi:hypothetical protein
VEQFGTGEPDKRRSKDRLAEHTGVQQVSCGLVGAAEERLQGAAETYVGGDGPFDQVTCVVHVQGERPLGVQVFTGVQDPPIELVVLDRGGQVDHEVDARIAQHVLDGHRFAAERAAFVRALAMPRDASDRSCKAGDRAIADR